MTAEKKYFKRKKMSIHVLLCLVGCMASLLLTLLRIWSLSFNVESVFLFGVGCVLFCLCSGYLYKFTSISGVEVRANLLIVYRPLKKRVEVDRVVDLVAVHTPTEKKSASSTLVYHKNGKSIRIVSNWFERENELISMLLSERG